MHENIYCFHSINGLYLPAILCRFLLASLNLDAIIGEVTIRQRKKKLEEVRRGNRLSGAYTTLTRLKAPTRHKSILGMKVLMWVLYSEWLLRAEEFYYALGVKIGSADLDPKNTPALWALIASSLGPCQDQRIFIHCPLSALYHASQTIRYYSIAPTQQLRKFVSHASILDASETSRQLFTLSPQQ